MPSAKTAAWFRRIAMLGFAIGIYHEAGAWTSLFAVFVAVQFELFAWFQANHLALSKDMATALSDIWDVVKAIAAKVGTKVE